MAKVPDVIECGESGSGSLTVNADGSQSRATVLRWLVGGLSGYDAAEARGAKLAPAIYKGNRRIRLEPQVVGGGWYQITAEYSNGSIVLPATPGCLGTFGSWQFDFETKTEHVSQAYTDSRANPGDSANPNAYVAAHIAGITSVTIGATSGGVFVPDFRGAIGVEVDQVRGADVPKASLSWSEVWHFPAWLLTQKRPPLKKLGQPDPGGNREVYEIEQPPLLEIFEKVANKTNSKPFRGFEEGEVFMGTPRSSQIQDGQSMATVTIPFSVSRTKRNFWVGDILVPIQGGWDILDVHYETASESTQITKKAKIVYVCKVIPPADFSDVGIGEALPKYWLDDERLSHQFDDFVSRA
jgi:hypothetical protein